MRTTRGVLFSLFSTLCVRSAFSRPQACDTRILRTCVWVGRKQVGGHAPTAKFQQKKLWEVTCVAGAKRGGRERKGNPMALPSSLLLNPLPPFLPTLRALYESKKRKGFWSFRFLNRETLRTRLRRPSYLWPAGTYKNKYVRHIRSWLPSHSKRKEKKDGGVFSLCSWSPVIPNFHEKQSSG